MAIEADCAYITSSPTGTFLTTGDFQAATTDAGWELRSLQLPVSPLLCALPLPEHT